MHRYQLQPYRSPSSRFDCPQCGGRKRFKRYIDTQTNQHLADYVGMCDRLDQCGYHFTPKQYFAANPHAKPQTYYRPHTPPPVAQMSTIPQALFKATLRRYGDNNFVRYLLTVFEEETVYRLINTYYIGTSKRWAGACIFWQIDSRHQIRTGKIMLYNPTTGKRVKEPYAHITWVHKLPDEGRGSSDAGRGSWGGRRGSGSAPHPSSHAPENATHPSPHAPKNATDPSSHAPKSTTHHSSHAPENATHPSSLAPDYNLKQCFFGEHLLRADNNALVAIVESEKTAIISAGFMPQYCWLAAGSLQGLTAGKCKVLQGRKVLLFPDSDGITAWQQRLQQLRQQLPGISFNMASYANGDAPGDGFGGVDIADWLVGVRW